MLISGGYTQSNAAGGALNAYDGYRDSGAITKAPEVRGRAADALEATDNLLHVIAERIGVLEQRLGPVLRSSVPTGQGAQVSGNREPSPLAVAIEGYNDRLSVMASHLQSIAERVDF